MSIYLRNNISGSGVAVADWETALVATLSIDSTDAEMQRSTSFDVTFNNPATTPTPANTSLVGGNDTLACTAVTVSDPYTATFTVGDLSKQVDGTGYVWTLTVDAETVDTSAIPLTIQADYTLVDLVDPVSTEGSLLEGYTGDAAVTGDHLEYDITSTLDADVTVEITATGEVNIEQVTDGDWTTDITIDRRVVQVDGTIGATETMTIEADVVPVMPADTSVSVVEGVTTVGTYAATAGDTPITYTLSGTDAADFSINSSTGAVTFNTAPDYETQTSHAITVTATNSTGNDSQAITVNVTDVDEVDPVITLTGNAAVNLTVGDTYTEQGATWTDNVDGSGSATVGGDTVDANTPATYTVTYNFTDAAGNAATQVTRTVVVSNADVVPDQMDLGADVTNAELGTTVDRTFTIAGIDAGQTVNVTATGSATVSAVTGQLGDTITVSLDASGSYDAVVTGGVTINGVSDSFQVTTRSAIASVTPEITVTGGLIRLVQPSATYADPTVSATDSNDVDVSNTAAWSGDTVNTSATLINRVDVSVMTGTIENAAAGQVAFVPDGSLPQGSYQYEGTALDENGAPVTFAIGARVVS